MPLRGSLFRKLQSVRNNREKAEARKFKTDVLKEAKSLKNLRTTRIKEEGRSLLRRAIDQEKQRIKMAKKPSKLGLIESFVAKQGKKAGVSLTKELQRRQARVKAGKPVFGSISQEIGLKKRSKKRKSGKRKRK